MKHELKKITPVLLIGTMLFTGCSMENKSTLADTSSVTAGEGTSESTESENLLDSVSTNSADQSSSSDSISTNSADQSSSADSDSTDQEYFSDRDFSTEIDTSEAVTITMNGSSVSADSDHVTVNGTTVTITEKGTYILSGNLEDGCVIVDAEDAKVQLVLDDLTINSKTFAPIYVAQADKVFVTLAEGSENVLSNGGSYTQIDDNNVDAVIFSKDDITLNGSGSLTIESPAGHGIVGKDEVTITGGTYTITASGTAIRANDSIAIADGTFNLNADSDGLHAENNDDDSLGFIYIQDGTFNINVGDDGIHATTTLVVDGGDFTIQAAEGMEATNITINGGDISIEATDDGINVGKKSSAYSVKITFNGGNTTIVMGSGDTDGVDSNGDLEINGGTINVTGNSTFDYDGNGVLNGGTVIVNGSEVSTLPAQTMGGGGMGGGRQDFSSKPSRSESNGSSSGGSSSNGSSTGGTDSISGATQKTDGE